MGGGAEHWRDRRTERPRLYNYKSGLHVSIQPRKESKATQITGNIADKVGGGCEHWRDRRTEQPRLYNHQSGLHVGIQLHKEGQAAQITGNIADVQWEGGVNIGEIEQSDQGYTTISQAYMSAFNHAKKAKLHKLQVK